MGWNPEMNRTDNVQVAITAANGTPVTDEQQVRRVLADALNLPYDYPAEHQSDGVWLVTLPTSLYQTAELNGGHVLTTRSGHVVEIPMP